MPTVHAWAWPHAGHVVATSTGLCSGSRWGRANESQAPLPHHNIEAPMTENPSGVAANGCAITMRSSASSTTCRALANFRSPSTTAHGSCRRVPQERRSRGPGRSRRTTCKRQREDLRGPLRHPGGWQGPLDARFGPGRARCRRGSAQSKGGGRYRTRRDDLPLRGAC